MDLCHRKQESSRPGCTVFPRKMFSVLGLVVTMLTYLLYSVMSQILKNNGTSLDILCSLHEHYLDNIVWWGLSVMAGLLHK